MRSEADVIQWLYGDDFRGNANPRTAKSLLTVDNKTALELNEKVRKIVMLITGFLLKNNIIYCRSFG